MGESYYDPGFNVSFSPNLQWHNEEDQFHGLEVGAEDHQELSVTEYSHAFVSMPEAPEIDLEEKDRGGEALVQTFYEGPRKCKCCTNWVEKPPPDIPEATQERYDKAAIRIYRIRGQRTSERMYGGVLGHTIKDIEIQSPMIIKAITPLLAEAGMPMHSERKGLLMSQPFMELYFAHSKIMNLVQRYDPSSVEWAHLNVLTQTLDELFADVSEEIKQLNAEKRTNCRWLWTLFPKGMIVYSRQDNQDRLYQTIDLRVDEKYQRIRVKCRYVRFDGVRFGTTRTVINIPMFHGDKLIRELPVFPLGFHSDPSLQKTLTERGSRLLDFQDMSYNEYDGVALAAKEDDKEEYDAMGRLKTYHVTGRIIIDSFGFGKFEPGCGPDLEKIEQESDDKEGGIEDNGSMSAVLREISNASEGGSRPSTETQQSNIAKLRLNRQCLCLMSPMLAGFSLKLKKWLWFSIDKVRPVLWNEDAYDHLVLQESRKDIIRTFVSSHAQWRANYNDDVIIGKGQGLVLLMSGPPGTGKTLTAEAVADKTRHPLYYLHAEELGSSAGSVGYRLSKAFDFATEWNAILLLDEADTFLAKRSFDSGSRNKMVAAIFQHLEYYRGVIFLTTNLLGSIDEAFLSRVHIHLCFPPLSAASRLTIWTNFLKRLPFKDASSMAQDDETGSQRISADLSQQDLTSLAEWSLNGREIKNVVKNAHIFCSYNRFSMTLARLEDAIQITTPFAERGSS